jgi:hypothetical protein
MPIFAAFFTSVVGAFASWLAANVTKRVTIFLSATIGLFMLSTSLVIVFNTLVTPLMQSVFQTQYGQFLGLAFPPIAGSCIASIGICWTACGVYKLNVASIKLTASA